MILIVVGVLVALVVVGIFVTKSSFVPPKGGAIKLFWKDRHHLPSLLSRLPLILVGAMFKKEGRFYSGLADFPETHIEVGASELELSHLKRYYQVCGFKAPEQEQEWIAPPCYPVMSIFNFQPFLVSMPSFPVSPLGVIHIRTILTQHKVLTAGQKLVYQINMKGHRATERGMEVDFVIKASLETGEVVWNCIETMLSRKPGSGGKKKPVPTTQDATAQYDGSVLFPVPENTGRRYASVVGDYNPHHMHKVPAMLFGFPKPIAHGQWSLEHSLAQLQLAGHAPRPPFKVDCHFKLPILMPGKCLLRWNITGSAVDFELRSADGVKPHLVGKLENLDKPGSLD